MQNKKNPRQNELPGFVNTSIITVWLFSLLLIVYYSLQPLPEIANQTRYLDKIVHMFSYLWLAILLFIYLKNSKMNLLIVLFLIFMGIALEIFQSYIPGRIFSVPDIIANILGVLAGVLLGKKIKYLLASTFSRV